MPASRTLHRERSFDWLHLHFRDARYTVTSTDCRAQTSAWMPFGPNIDPDTGVQTYTKIDVILSPDDILAGRSPFAAGDTITIERTGTNEETTTVIEVGVDETSGPYILAWVTKAHTADVYIDRQTRASHVAEKLAAIINTFGATVAGRFGPDYSRTIKATVGAGSTQQSATICLEFKSPEYHKYYGKLGNLDRILVTQGRTIGGVPDGQQGFKWADGSGYSVRFACPSVIATFMPVTPVLSTMGPRCKNGEAFFFEDQQVVVCRDERAAVVDTGSVCDDVFLDVLIEVPYGD